MLNNADNISLSKISIFFYHLMFLPHIQESFCVNAIPGPRSVERGRGRGSLLRYCSLPIKHAAVAFPLCPCSADKRPVRGVCQPSVRAVTSETCFLTVCPAANSLYICLSSLLLTNSTHCTALYSLFSNSPQANWCHCMSAPFSVHFNNTF